MADISVQLIDFMGNDTRVPFVARASTKIYDKLVFDPDTLKLDFEKSGIVWQGERDEGLIDYMAENGHWSPFAHCALSFAITAPLFVARQLQKSTVGLAWNEQSRRYIDAPPEFYVPDARKRAPKVKQGSLDDLVDEVPVFDHMSGNTYLLPPQMLFEAKYQEAMDAYNALLDGGVAPEVARAILPQGMMTQFIWTGSLYAFARVCNLRLDLHAQKESRLVAEKIHFYMKHLFPIATKALVKVES